MFEHSPYSFEIDIYRKKRVDSWGDEVEENHDSEKVKNAAMYGVPYSHTLSWGVPGPRTTEQSRQAPQYAPMTYSGITLFCDAYADIRSDDIVSWVNLAGERKVYRVEGTHDNEFVSPWTSLGGKEVHLGSVKPRNSLGRGE